MKIERCLKGGAFYTLFHVTCGAQPRLLASQGFFRLDVVCACMWTICRRRARVAFRGCGRHGARCGGASCRCSPLSLAEAEELLVQGSSQMQAARLASAAA